MERAARALIPCCYTTVRRAASLHDNSNNLNNIKGLQFYHSIRGHLENPVQTLGRVLRESMLDS
jgi:hypothetical protein